MIARFCVCLARLAVQVEEPTYPGERGRVYRRGLGTRRLLHRAGAGSAQEFLEVTMATTKRDLFASAEDDLKSNSGGHYLKDCAQHLARLLSPSGRSCSIGSG